MKNNSLEEAEKVDTPIKIARTAIRISKRYRRFNENQRGDVGAILGMLNMAYNVSLNNEEEGKMLLKEALNTYNRIISGTL